MAERGEGEAPESAGGRKKRRRSSRKRRNEVGEKGLEQTASELRTSAGSGQTAETSSPIVLPVHSETQAQSKEAQAETTETKVVTKRNSQPTGPQWWASLLFDFRLRAFVSIGVVMFIIALVLMLLLPTVLAEKNISPWILYAPFLIAFISWFSFFDTFQKDPELNSFSADRQSRLQLLFANAGFLQMVICVGFVWYVAHAVPHARLGQGDKVTGDIYAESRKLLTKRDACMSKQIWGSDRKVLVFFQNGFINKSQTFSKQWDIPAGKNQRRYLKTAIAPVYKSEDPGPIIAWAFPYDAGDSNEIDSDTCKDGPDALGGLCGTLVSTHGSADSFDDTVAYCRLAGTKRGDILISSWLQKYGATVSWKSFASFDAAADNRVAIIGKLPVFQFRDPSEQQLRIAMWKHIGLGIFVGPLGVLLLVLVAILYVALYQEGTWSAPSDAERNDQPSDTESHDEPLKIGRVDQPFNIENDNKPGVISDSRVAENAGSA